MNPLLIALIATVVWLAVSAWILMLSKAYAVRWRIRWYEDHYRIDHREIILGVFWRWRCHGFTEADLPRAKAMLKDMKLRTGVVHTESA